MPTVRDVAAYILSKQSPMTAMKLQKLCFYSQAWSLVWDEKPLFNDNFEAWANGPVCPVLYYYHRGKFQVGSGDIEGNPSAIDSVGVETIDAVLENYGDKSSQWLSDLTHSESPWKDAREGLKPGERGEKIISTASIAEYYGSL